MSEDKFKREIAEVTAEAFKQAFPDLFKPDLFDGEPEPFIFDPEQVSERLEIPKKPEMGNYALPLFELAKVLKQNPANINKELVERQNQLVKENSKYEHLSFEAVGGFNNSRIDTSKLAGASIKKILEKGGDYGSSDEGAGKNIVIDFSSPNIAKPFGIGHLRTTAIGHSLYRIFEKLGYNSVGINHLGDWGTQFGKLIVAFRNWGRVEDLKDEPVLKLYNLYVKFHKEEEKDPELTDRAREAFRNLEKGSQEEAELWKMFKDHSLDAFKKTYERLGIKFDHYTGESFYNIKMQETLERLKNSGLTEYSEGALIVPLEKYDLPACLLAKADGATLYATRDIAGVLYRKQEFDFEQALYVVATSQRVHFQQVFKVIELLEKAEGVPSEQRCSDGLVHVEFGWIKFKDQMMSTRKGNIIFLDDVLDKAVKLAKEKIMEKNPNLENMDETAEQIGVGAVLFADMSTRRMKDVNFDWDEVLNFEGETGPYLQYTHARLASLLRRSGMDISPEIDYSYIDKPEEYRVLELLYKFPSAIKNAAENYEPHVIVAYLIELAGAFNRVYQRKDEKTGRIDKIISENEKQTEARLALVMAVKTVLKEGLYLLGIEAPEAM